MFEREYRDLAHVPRWAILPTTRTQSVAEHSFFVALYAAEIVSFALESGHCEVEDFAIIVQYALVHDRDESYLSDIPGPVKRNIVDSDKVKAYTKKMEETIFEAPIDVLEVYKRVVKVADLMDEVAFLWGESQMGNVDASHLLRTTEKRLFHAVDRLPWFNNEEKDYILDQFREKSRRPKTFPENNNDVAS